MFHTNTWISRTLIPLITINNTAENNVVINKDKYHSCFRDCRWQSCIGNEKEFWISWTAMLRMQQLTDTLPGKFNRLFYFIWRNLPKILCFHTNVQQIMLYFECKSIESFFIIILTVYRSMFSIKIYLKNNNNNNDDDEKIFIHTFLNIFNISMKMVQWNGLNMWFKNFSFSIK